MHLKFKHLLDISAKLRGEGGCPWDREQTLETMRPLVLDEAQELSEAIEHARSAPTKKNIENIEEEIGDVLFCLIMISQIAHEKGHFDMGTVLEKNVHKLISRHTWVFGDDKAETAEEALALWKKNKHAEAKRRRIKKEKE